jgi:hypothetical protein
MKRFARKTTLVALVWLTAASTLLAGLPRLECVCPSRPREPAPPRAKARETGGCCSGGSCCCTAQPEGGSAPAPGERRGQHGCCPSQGHAPRPASPRPTGDDPGNAPSGPRGPQTAGTAGSPGLDLPRCARTLTPSSSINPAITQPDIGGLPATELLAPQTAVPGPALSPGEPPSRRCWLISHAPPPTDLILTLQHLLI